MSQENENGAGTAAGDEQSSQKKDRSIDSVLAETNRKFSKLEQENAKLSQQLEQMLGLMQKPAPSSQSVNEESDLEDLIYKDPKQYAKKVTEKAAREATQMVQQQLNKQNETNQVLSAMVNDYPELSDVNSEISKRAVELFKQLPEHERTSSVAYKAVIREAAAELGVLPKSKRTSKSDDFTMGSGGGTSKAPKTKELDDNTLKFASALGLDITDKKVVERLKNRSQRKNWNNYE